MSTLKEAKAARRRQKSVSEAVEYWKSQANILGVTNAGRRGGINRIEESGRPMQTARALVREFQERAAKGMVGVERAEMADLSDVQVLRVKLYRRRGGGWFPSDPQYRMLGDLARRVADGMTATEFERAARVITAMPRPYSRAMLIKELASASYETAQPKGLPPRPSVRLHHDHSADAVPAEWLAIPDFLDRRRPKLRVVAGMAIPSTMAA